MSRNVIELNLVKIKINRPHFRARPKKVDHVLLFAAVPQRWMTHNLDEMNQRKKLTMSLEETWTKVIKKTQTMFRH